MEELRKLFKGAAEVKEQREAGTMSRLETWWNVSYTHFTRDAQPGHKSQVNMLRLSTPHSVLALLCSHPEAVKPDHTGVSYVC